MNVEHYNLGVKLALYDAGLTKRPDNISRTFSTQPRANVTATAKLPPPKKVSPTLKSAPLISGPDDKNIPPTAK